MSQIALQASATGTGVVTLAAPVTNTNRTITLPDATATLSALSQTGSAPFYAARAWAVIAPDGTLLAGGNIASVTRLSAGNYSVIMTVAMPNLNYAPIPQMNVNTTAANQTTEVAKIRTIVSTTEFIIISGQTEDNLGLDFQTFVAVFA